MSKDKTSKKDLNSALRKTDVRRCCHLECRSKATHSIYYSKQYEDYSDFCGKHLHQYLPNNYNVIVSPITPNMRLAAVTDLELQNFKL